MMDISRVVRGAIVGSEGDGHRSEVDAGQGESGEDAEERGKESRRACRKRGGGADDDYANSKKRRKQLKPIRIATNLEDMVKVPKQIVGLNNDLDNLNDMSHAVPMETSSKAETSPNLTLSDDVHIRSDVSSSDPHSNGSAEKHGRDADKPDIPEINVPSLEVGPNFMTNPNYIFPFSFRPVKSPHFWSEANLKIFNQEAYCELCKKEFCNKYFLKTHKANKHGIYADFPSGKGKATEGRDAGKAPENGKNVAGDGTDCERAFCELCNKKFCNKYFVRRHKTKSHGVPDEENHFGLACQDATESTNSSVVQNAVINSTKKAEAREDEFDNQGKDVQETPLNLIVKDGSDEEAGEDADDGDECSGENIEKLQTMLLRLNPSEIDGKVCKTCREVADASGEHKCEKAKFEYLSEANDSSNESKNEFLPKSESHDFVYVNRLDHLKQMKPTSSYCEICNKELCNKYFMRTHMQRMHGIEIEHGTQIGGVVCNICNKELCSKYFLRVHKQNTHGIVSPNSLVGPSTSGGSLSGGLKSSRSDTRFASTFSQVCYICNKRFRSPKWLQAHLLSDHRDEAAKKQEDAATSSTAEEEEDNKEDESVLKIPKKSHRGAEPPEAFDVISKLFWENNSTTKSYNCSQCPFSTSVLAFLFVHERSHYVLTQDHVDPSKAPPLSLHSLLQSESFWQRKITQQISECLDLSSGKSKYLSFERNGS